MWFKIQGVTGVTFNIILALQLKNLRVGQIFLTPVGIGLTALHNFTHVLLKIISKKTLDK